MIKTLLSCVELILAAAVCVLSVFSLMVPLCLSAARLGVIVVSLVMLATLLRCCLQRIISTVCLYDFESLATLHWMPRNIDDN